MALVLALLLLLSVLPLALTMDEDDMDSMVKGLDNDFTCSQMHMQEGRVNVLVTAFQDPPRSIIDGAAEFHKGKTTKVRAKGGVEGGTWIGSDRIGMSRDDSDSPRILFILPVYVHLLLGLQYFNDPVQGHLRIDPSCVEIIDTPQFQRLRDLKQLGCTYYVFPGACHNRFEHSLGVSYLAEDVVSRIFRTQKKDLEMEGRDVSLVRLAGLIHDIGHGPFSHVFENEFLPNVGVQGFHHEEMTESLLDYLVDDNNIDLNPSDLSTIKALVRSDIKSNLERKNFLKEIVANSRNSVDVDKFDYMERDCYHCGIKASCDFSRLRSFLKVINDEICYRASEVSNVYDLFATRASLHKKVYTHRKVSDSGRKGVLCSP